MAPGTGGPVTVGTVSTLNGYEGIDVLVTASGAVSPFSALQKEDRKVETASLVQLRDLIGVETLLWGSDYPHAESTFPRSRAIVDRILQGVPEVEQAQIAGGNTARLYHFG